MSQAFGVDYVKLIRWPTEALQRAHLKSTSTPRILVVEAGSAAPICADIYEDWVRAPISHGDLQARIDALRVKSKAFRTPRVDSGGTLWVSGRSSVVSPTEADLLKPLIEKLGSVVPREELRAILSDRDQPATRNALDLHIKRLRRRISPLGLVIRTSWGRGYQLECGEQVAS